MKMGMGGMSFCSGGGVGASYINPDIPAVENIVRAWSLRRNVPDYMNGNAIKELRSNGGTETDVPFNAAGVCDITGADAFANVLYDQKGTDAAKLLNATFTACPKVYESSAMLQGLKFDGGDFLRMASPDSALDTAFSGTAYSFSGWAKCSQTNAAVRTIMNRVNAVSGFFILAFYGGKARAYIKNVSYPIDSSNAIDADGNWHLITATNIATGVPKLYVDGVLVGQDIARSPSTGFSGVLTFGANAVGGDLLTGSINDIIVWNVELSLAQIGALYNAQKAYYGL